MSEYILVLVNLLLVLIEFATFIILLSACFNIEKTTLHRFLVYAVGFLIECIVIGTLSDFAMIKTLLCMMIVMGTSKIIYRVQYGYCILVAVLYTSIAYLTDLGMIYLVSGWAGTDLNSLLSRPFDYYLLACISKIVQLSIVIDIRTWGKQHFHHRQATMQNYLLVMALPFASLACGLLLFNTYFQFPTAQPVKIRDRHILTTKKDSMRYGYGLKNVLAISAAHGGDCAFHYDNRVFSCVPRFDIEV